MLVCASNGGVERTEFNDCRVSAAERKLCVVHHNEDKNLIDVHVREYVEPIKSSDGRSGNRINICVREAAAPRFLFLPPSFCFTSAQRQPPRRVRS